MRQRVVEPLARVFGKDVANLIYRWQHRMLLSAINEEYYQLFHCNLCRGKEVVTFIDKNQCFGFAFNARKISTVSSDIFTCIDGIVWTYGSFLKTISMLIKNRGDPLVNVLGKDIADIVYRWRYRLMFFDICSEYRKRLRFVGDAYTSVRFYDEKRLGGFDFNYRTQHYKPNIYRWNKVSVTHQPALSKNY